MNAYEEATMKEELRSVQSLMDDELARLTRVTADWAAWDDTYVYATARNKEYIERNLYAEAVNAIDVDTVIIYDNNRKPIFSRGYGNATSGSLTRETAELFNSKSSLLCADGNIDKPVTGLVSGDSIYMVAAIGITDSLMSKAKAGTLVFARKIDTPLLAHFGKIADATVHFFDLSEDNRELTAYAAKTDAQGEYVGSAGGEKNIGILKIKDITGKTLIGLAVYKDKLTGTFYSVDSIVASFSLSIVIILALIYFLFRFFITNPIDEIVEHLDKIDITGKSGFRALPVTGKDEISRIKVGINKLFRGVTDSISNISQYLEMAGALIVALDVEAKVVLANRKCCETLGLNEEEILGKDWINAFVADKWKDNTRGIMNKLLCGEDQVAEHVENRIIAANGQERIIIWHNAAIRDADGNISGILSSGEDITEKRAIHNMVSQNAERLKKAEEIAHIGSWEMDIRTGKVIWSDEFFRICGYEPHAVYPSIALMVDLIHPDDRDKFETAFDSAVINRSMYETEIRIVRPDGGIRWVSSKGIAETCNKDELKKITGTILDITGIKEAERQIRQNTERNESLVRILQYNAENNQDLLDYVLNEAIKLTESKVGYIYFYDEEKRKLTLNTWSRDVLKECRVMDRNTVYQLDTTGLWGEAVRQRKPIMVNDFLAPSPYKKGCPEGHVKLFKFLTVPVFSNDKIVAVIGLGNKETDYTQMDVLQLTLLMNNVWEIIERIRTDSLLKEERERLRITLLSVGDGVISTDKNGNVEIINEVAQKLTGWDEKDAIGRPFEEVFNIINEYTRETCESPVRKVLECGEIIELRNHTLLVSRDGTERPIADSAAPIVDDSGMIQGVVMVFRDFTEEKQKKDEIEYLSYHDQLTGLYNRRFYEEELRRLDNRRNLPLSVVMGDVNGLKLTNDAFGHAVGDRLLQKAAEIMKATCRQDDIIARYGGDEFIIVLPKTSVEEAEEIVNRIRAAISNVEIDSVMLSISFGWDVKVNEHEDISDILKKAEDYMYTCKLFESPSMRGQTVYTIINTLHEKNMREKQHSERVSKLCEMIGYAMALSEKGINEIRTAGLLHDIGKIAISEQVLNKSGKLTDDEWDEIKRHPEIGYRILSAVNDMTELAEHILSHHEHWDGTGYPKGLSGEKIPLHSRIIAVADAYDAMTSERPYREALTEEEAVREIIENAGTQFDPKIARLFVEKVLKKTWDKKETVTTGPIAQD
ncbi:MAG: HD domain-containing phosphohydrolase [Bacillota bacterium]